MNLSLEVWNQAELRISSLSSSNVSLTDETDRERSLMKIQAGLVAQTEIESMCGQNNVRDNRSM